MYCRHALESTTHILFMLFYGESKSNSVKSCKHLLLHHIIIFQQIGFKFLILVEL